MLLTRPATRFEREDRHENTRHQKGEQEAVLQGERSAPSLRVLSRPSLLILLNGPPGVHKRSEFILLSFFSFFLPQLFIYFLKTINQDMPTVKNSTDARRNDWKTGGRSGEGGELVAVIVCWVLNPVYTVLCIPSIPIYFFLFLFFFCLFLVPLLPLNFSLPSRGPSCLFLACRRTASLFCSPSLASLLLADS